MRPSHADGPLGPLPRLLAISDRRSWRNGGDLVSWLRELARTGSSFAQIRERDLDDSQTESLCRDLRQAVDGYPWVLHRRCDLVAGLDLDGVHLPSDGLPVAVGRRFLGARKWVGRSTHSLQEVRAAGRDGADYVVFGPLRAKNATEDAAPDLGALADAAGAAAPWPLFALGGVRIDDIAACAEAGAHGVAGIRLFASDALEQVVAEAHRCFGPSFHSPSVEPA